MLDGQNALFSPYVIFAVDGDASEADRFAAHADAHGHAYKRLLGSYMGELEASFITDAETFTAIVAEGWVKHQDSVLYLTPYKRKSGHRKAWLVYDPGEPVAASRRLPTYLGDWRHVSAEHALASPGWTQDVTTGRYYVAGPDCEPVTSARFYECVEQRGEREWNWVC